MIEQLINPVKINMQPHYRAGVVRRYIDGNRVLIDRGGKLLKTDQPDIVDINEYEQTKTTNRQQQRRQKIADRMAARGFYPATEQEVLDLCLADIKRLSVAGFCKQHGIVDDGTLYGFVAGRRRISAKACAVYGFEYVMNRSWTQIVNGKEFAGRDYFKRAT